MDPTTIRLPDDLLDELDAEADERDMKRSDYIREVLQDRHDYDRLQAEYEAEIDDLKQEVERLNRERRQLLEQRSENQELRRYVENDVEWHEASLPTRVRWWLFGKD